MTCPTRSSVTRRDLLQAGSAAAMAGLVRSAAYAGEDNTIRLALIGSGNRGSGAVANALQTTCGPVKLAVMADLFDERLQRSLKALSKMFPDKVDVPRDRQFIGFDAYRKAIDSLKSGDVAMLTGYAGFRPTQLEYAVQKGVNVFMEKSFATDPFGVKRVIAAGAAAEKKNLKIAAGVMCRHSRNRQELIRRIHEGELGDILLSRAYRMQSSGNLGKKIPDETELAFQLRNFTKFLWVSGGLWAEMDIHQIDELCWLHDALPLTAHGVGGRAANNTDASQNLDSFSAEWTFPNGSKAYDVVRYIPKCHNEFATFVHGAKRAAQFSGQIHAGTVRIYKDQRIADDNILWEATEKEIAPWQFQWDDFMAAIRRDEPFNQAKRAALSNLATIMGRAAMHGGQLITWDQAMASNFHFCPGIDTMNYDTQPPIKPDAGGRYPVPIPGVWKEI